MIIKTSLTVSKILEGFQIRDFFKEQQTPHKQPFCQQVPANRFDDDDAREGAGGAFSGGKLPDGGLVEGP